MFRALPDAGTIPRPAHGHLRAPTEGGSVALRSIRGNCTTSADYYPEHQRRSSLPARGEMLGAVLHRASCQPSQIPYIEPGTLKRETSAHLFVCHNTEYLVCMWESWVELVSGTRPAPVAVAMLVARKCLR